MLECMSCYADHEVSYAPRSDACIHAYTHTLIVISCWLTIPMSVFSVKSGFEKKKLKARVLDNTKPLSSPVHV